jgi:Ca2+-binding RTX toxin-like protein
VDSDGEPLTITAENPAAYELFLYRFKAYNPSDGGDVLIGAAGNDVLAGGLGDDTLDAGAGVNLVDGGAGDDVIDFSASALGRTFNLTGINAGAVDGSGFTSVENLQAGSGDDVFVFAAGAGISGALAAGAGTDTLDYSSLPNGVLVNLDAGTATGTGSVGGIENVTGGAGDDLVIGNDAANVLIGNGGDDVLVGLAGADVLFGLAGADILIGGAGADSVHGANGQDILIGGRTIYDTNIEALLAIHAEWTRTGAGFLTRTLRLNGTWGGGLNGAFVLNETTVIDDNAIDVLLGQGDLDWFLAGSTDDTDTITL